MSFSKVFSITLLVLSILTGCANGSVEIPQTLPDMEPDLAGLSFTEAEFPRLDGSTATIPLGEALAALMMGKNRAECAEYAKFSGTNEAYKKLVSGRASILLVYEMPDDASAYIQGYAAQLETAPIGRDALVFVVNARNPIDNLTTQQVIDIYSGKIRNWKDVGGADEEIAAYQRNAESGSQTLMQKLVMKNTPMMRARHNFVVTTMAYVAVAVAAYENGRSAIGYNVFYYLAEMQKDKNIKILSIDGVLPSKESIRSGKYPFVNDFYAVIRGSAAEDGPERLLFRWLQTAEGKALIDHENYVTSSERIAQ